MRKLWCNVMQFFISIILNYNGSHEQKRMCLINANQKIMYTRKNSTPENYVKLRYFTQWALLSGALYRRMTALSKILKLHLILWCRNFVQPILNSSETVHFNRISTLRNYVKLRYFMQCRFRERSSNVDYKSWESQNAKAKWNE